MESRSSYGVESQKVKIEMCITKVSQYTLCIYLVIDYKDTKLHSL